MSIESATKIIKKETIQRLIKDVKELKGHPLSENHIYYYHDEEDLLKGYALIIGTENTPYFAGYYFFELNYPTDYPYSPPIVTYLTNGDNIRFNPNLYVNGKVCISLLNTWRGEQWTSCQSITTVLLTLGTLLCSNPLLNEPGVLEGHYDCKNYNKIIEYKNIDIAILDVLTEKCNQIQMIIQLFKPIVLTYFSKNYEKIKELLEKKIDIELYPKLIKTNIYNMNVQIDYSRLYKKLMRISSEFIEKNEKIDKSK
jgi:ubiquitin-protein ligase